MVLKELMNLLMNIHIIINQVFMNKILMYLFYNYILFKQMNIDLKKIQQIISNSKYPTVYIKNIQNINNENMNKLNLLEEISNKEENKESLFVYTYVNNDNINEPYNNPMLIKYLNNKENLLSNFISNTIDNVTYTDGNYWNIKLYLFIKSNSLLINIKEN